MLNRITPDKEYDSLPVSHTAIHTAYNNLLSQRTLYARRLLELPRVRRSKVSVSELNSCIRKYFRVKKHLNFKADERMSLREFLINRDRDDTQEAMPVIVMVGDNCVYVDRNNDYWSFKDSLEDEVKNAWLLNYPEE